MPECGRRIFVVEDESLVLLNLEDMLTDMGWTIAAQAMILPEAVRLAATVEQPDAAILDVNIGGAAVFPAAQILVDRGVPILFATGYGQAGLPDEWQDHRVIMKPYTQGDVALALDALLSVEH